MTNSTKAFYDMSISSLAFACKNKAQYTGLYTCIILMPACMESYRAHKKYHIWDTVIYNRSPRVLGIPILLISSCYSK